jgi:hypothetical protein
MYIHTYIYIYIYIYREREREREECLYVNIWMYSKRVLLHHLLPPHSGGADDKVCMCKYASIHLHGNISNAYVHT